MDRKDKDDQDKKVLGFDMMHYGHANALRKAKVLYPNSYLIVGVHSDEEILLNKGPTVMNSQERYEAVRACRYVDEVAEAVPYNTKLSILNKHNVAYCIHGDDASYDAQGNNTYQELIDAGKYQTVPRTRGVSTTNIVRRLLKHAKDPETDVNNYSFSQGNPIEPDEDRIFFPSALQILQFSKGIREPTKNDKIVYVDGTFDLFHVGHVEFLKRARAAGTYLIVGIHDDLTIGYYKGPGFPVLNLHERLLSVLACKYVDNVVIGAPFCVTKQMIDNYDIEVVVVGSKFDVPLIAKEKDIDPYKVPKKLKMLKKVNSPRIDLNLYSIIERIQRQSKLFIQRNKKKKMEKEVFEQIKKEKLKGDKGDEGVKTK